jgi:hypothetical protein
MGNSDLYELIVFDRLRARVSNLNDRERPDMRADEELPVIKQRHTENEMPMMKSQQIIGSEQLNSGSNHPIAIIWLGRRHHRRVLLDAHRKPCDLRRDAHPARAQTSHKLQVDVEGILNSLDDFNRFHNFEHLNGFERP